MALIARSSTSATAFIVLLLTRQSHSTSLSSQSLLIDAFADFISTRSHLVLLTGAGVSTASGIPDYRSPTGSYSRGHKPIQHRDFVQNEASRRRYWARSMLGWRLFADSQPTLAHRAFAKLEAQGLLQFTITQNVDRLHQRAGSVQVLDLHGRNDRVKCLSCAYAFSRRIMQSQLDLLNPEVAAKYRGVLPGERLRADGDAEIDPADMNIQVPCCPRCGGVLKPEVVYFGDSVPADAVATANQHIEACDGLLVAGSSLEVFSAYRLVARASTRCVPIVIVNKGETRAERSGVPLHLKLEDDCDRVMESVLLKAGLGTV